MSILPVLFFGTFALLFMAVAIIAFVLFYQRRVIAHQLQIRQQEEEMQRELLRATIRAQEDEMQRIGKDLHDEIGISIVAVKNDVRLAALLVSEKASTDEQFENIKLNLENIRTEIRKVSHRLFPSALEIKGLPFALQKICSELDGHEKIKISFHLLGESKTQTREIEIALYRIALECMNNAIKHSKCTEINVSLNYTEQNILLEISDNGKGFDATDLMKQEGLGLKNIQSRAKAIGAELKFTSDKSGTKVLMSYSYTSIKN